MVELLKLDMAHVSLNDNKDEGVPHHRISYKTESTTGPAMDIQMNQYNRSCDGNSNELYKVLHEKFAFANSHLSSWITCYPAFLGRDQG